MVHFDFSIHGSLPFLTVFIDRSYNSPIRIVACCGTPNVSSNLVLKNISSKV